MGKDQPETHTTTQTSAPPEFLMPYLEHSLGQARNLYDTRPIYADTTVPGAAMEGFGMGQDVARNPALINPSIGLAQSTIAGDYLDPMALRNAARGELNDVIGGTLGAFERSGRTGSPAAMEALGRGVTTALAPVYQRERGLQQQMGLAAPGLEASRYMPSQNLVNLAMQQRGIEDRYYQEPWERLARYTGLALGGAPAQYAGGTVTNEQPIYQPSPFSQIAGLGLMGAGLFM